MGLNPGRLWWCAPGDAVLGSDPVLAAFLPVKGHREPFSTTRSTSLDLLLVGWLGLAPFLCLPSGRAEQHRCSIKTQPGGREEASAQSWLAVGAPGAWLGTTCLLFSLFWRGFQPHDQPSAVVPAPAPAQWQWLDEPKPSTGWCCKEKLHCAPKLWAPALRPDLLCHGRIPL